jgi:hypothetical protein
MLLKVTVLLAVKLPLTVVDPNKVLLPAIVCVPFDIQKQNNK